LTAVNFIHIADVVPIDVSQTWASTNTKGVELVAIAIAVAFWNVRASTLVDLSWTIADTAGVIGANAVVYIVTNAIRIDISCTRASTNANGVELVAIAVAVACWNVSASTLVDFSWTVAHSTSVVRANAFINDVTDAICIDVSWTRASTNAKGVELVAIAIAVACWNVRTSTLINLSWAIANTAGVIGPNAVVHIVTDAIRIGVS